MILFVMNFMIDFSAVLYEVHVQVLRSIYQTIPP